MFGLNSPSHPERARDRRVRLAHPDSQIQLSNSVIKLASQSATAFNNTVSVVRRQAGETNFLRDFPPLSKPELAVASAAINLTGEGPRTTPLEPSPESNRLKLSGQPLQPQQHTNPATETA